MTLKFAIETDDLAQAARIVAALGGDAPVTGNGQGATPAKNYFPADPALAPFPSPEGSMISLINGKIYLYDSSTDTTVQRDDAFLRDVDGKIVTFQQPITLINNLYTAGQVPVVFENGQQPIKWFAGDQVAISNGVAWVHNSNKWFYIQAPTSGSGGNLLSLVYSPEKGKQYVPTAQASGTGGTMPTAPAAVSPAPGTSGKTLSVPAQFATLTDALAAAANGDTIHVDPSVTLKESVAINKAVKIVSDGKTANPGTAGAIWSGGAKIDVTGVVLAQGKGALVPLTDCVFEGLEIMGAGLDQAVGQGTAGIRNGAAGNFVVRDCFIHDNQDGMFSGGYAATWLVENCLLKDNGIGDGQTHNVYWGQEVVNATFNNTTSIQNPVSASPLRASGSMNGGHSFKSRAAVTNISGCYGYAADATVVDLPDGSAQVCNIKSMSFVKKAGDANHGVLGYGSEGKVHGTAGAIVSACSFDLLCDAPFVQSGGGVVMFDGTNTFTGNKPVPSLVGGTVSGLPA